MSRRQDYQGEPATLSEMIMLLICDRNFSNVYRSDARRDLRDFQGEDLVTPTSHSRQERSETFSRDILHPDLDQEIVEHRVLLIHRPIMSIVRLRRSIAG